MKKVGSSFKKLSGLIVGGGIILFVLFFLFKMFSGSREGFACRKDHYCVCPVTGINTCTNKKKQKTFTCSCTTGNTGSYQ